jgi:hypothetical protein
MAYSIQKTSGQTLSTIADGTVDNTTDLKLIGKNFAGYGEIQNENFVFLLENFASAQQPPRPIAGQVWFDSGENKLKFYDGSAWKTTGGTTSTTTQPVNLSEGDLWFDNVNQKLYIYNGADFSFIGPQDAGDGLTQMQSREIIATDNTSKAVVVATIEDEEIAIFSNTNFTIKDTGTQFADFAGFVDNNRTVKKGITLKGNDENGVNTETFFYGTATNANKLGGFSAANYVRSDQANFSGTVVNFDDNGINIGNDQDMSIVIDGSGGNEGHVKMNQQLLKFSTYNGATYNEVFRINGSQILPGGTPVSQVSPRSIGDATSQFSEVHAQSFKGTSDRANEMRVGLPANNEYITASYTYAGAADANTVVARDDNGNIAANELYGVSSRAKYADLAEIYKSENNDIPMGTIVGITGGRGDTEIGPAFINGASASAIGVISTAPAYLMNADASGQAVGLIGRVPTLVKGVAKMGASVYVSNDPGIGTTEPDPDGPLCLVGYILEEDAGTSEAARLVECFIKC